MSKDVIEKIFGEGIIRFRPDGWFCATDAAKMFQYKPDNWVRSEAVRGIIIEIASSLDYSNSLKLRELELEEAEALLIQTSRGRYGSTWMHPDLAVPFAMAVNPKFGVWVTRQIKHILLDERHKIEQWHAARQGTKESNKFRNSQVDAFEGRSSVQFAKYSTEIWFICSGSFKDRIVREELSVEELRILQDIERCQAFLIEIQQDWNEMDQNYKRREILINRVNRLRAEIGLNPVDHSVFWTKAQEDYARRKEAMERASR